MQRRHKQSTHGIVKFECVNVGFKNQTPIYVFINNNVCAVCCVLCIVIKEVVIHLALVLLYMQYTYMCSYHTSTDRNKIKKRSVANDYKFMLVRRIKF